MFLDIAFTLGLGYVATKAEEYDRLLEQNPALRSAIPNLVACQGIRVVFEFLAVLGGFAAVRRVQFGFAVAGGIFAMLALMTSVLALLLGVVVDSDPTADPSSCSRVGHGHHLEA